MLLYVDSQFASPYAMSVFVGLLEKKVAFEIEPVDLAANANQEPAFAATSITRRVPTLIHDGFALSESSAISEYIDETFPGAHLYPADPRHRARARQVQAWLRSDLAPIRDERPTIVVFYEAKMPPLSAAARGSAEKLFSAANALLDGRSGNLFGDWCIADVDLSMMLNRLIVHGDPVPDNLVAYATQHWQRPSVQQWANKPRPALGVP
jgi:glutathione S-transferase